MRESCKKMNEELINTNNELRNNLKTLKKDWNTPAGKRFFTNLDEDWETMVNQYSKITESICQLLETALKEYQKVERDIENLHF